MKMRVIKINEGTLEMKAKLEKYSHHIKYMQHNEETQFVLHKIHPIEFRNYVPCTIKGSLKTIDGATLLTYRVFPTLFTTINIGIMVAIVIAFFLFAAKTDITFFQDSLVIGLGCIALYTAYVFWRIDIHERRFRQYVMNNTRNEVVC